MARNKYKMMNKNRSVKIQSIKNQTWIADECYVAESFYARFRGLIGMGLLEPGQGLWLTRCNSIHMWFMSISIDVVFMKKVVMADGRVRWSVTSVRENIRPWRILPLGDGKASETLELSCGTIRRCDIQMGDLLCTS